MRNKGRDLSPDGEDLSKRDLLSRPSVRRAINFALFGLGIMLLSFGVVHGAEADLGDYNAERITQATNSVLMYLEGSFGALVMVCAGIGAILSAAFGQYRASLGLMVVAIGAFILRSLMDTFFNTEGIRE